MRVKRVGGRKCELSIESAQAQVQLRRYSLHYLPDMGVEPVLIRWFK